MSLKLIFFLLGLILATFFIGFNLENRCNISLLFYTYENVPIFVSLLFAYVFGAISVIPFVIGKKKKPLSNAKPVEGQVKLKKEQKNKDEVKEKNVEN